MSDSPIDLWLASHVNSTHFQAKLEAEIDNLDKPQDRVRARLELLSYVMPKVKGIDPIAPDQRVNEIKITYVQARPPKKSKDEKAD